MNSMSEYNNDSLLPQKYSPIQTIFDTDKIKTKKRIRKLDDINFIKIQNSDKLYVSIDYATNPETKDQVKLIKQCPSTVQPSPFQTLEIDQTEIEQLIYQDERLNKRKRQRHKNKEQYIERLEYESSDESPKPRKHKHTKDSGSSKGQEKFHWSSEPSIVFTFLVLMLNVKVVKPKQIVKYFPSRYPVDTQVISSHLQKYKLKIQRDHKLKSAKDIQPYMYPLIWETKYIKEISAIIKENPDKVFTDEEINKYLSLFII